jgi:DNA polymerase-1
VLEDLAAAGHELPRKIVDWRQLTKLKSTYTDALPSYVHPETKRVHTSYALAATTTGRLSSSEPNLQNIPIRTAAGRKIRTAFISTPGHKLVSADYSQIELRVLAHVAEYPAAEAGLRGRYRHSRDDGVGNVRRAGEGHAGRSAPSRQGDQLRHHLRHFRLRPCQPARHRALGGRRLHQEAISSASRASAITWMAPSSSAATTAMSRRSSAAHAIIRRSAPPIHRVRAFNERAAINAPIQGSAADIIRRAMIKDGAGAGCRRSRRAACCCRCMTN